MSKPYRARRFGILNHEGGIWTPETFDTEKAGQEYIDRYQKGFKGDLSRHRIVPVRVTVSILKPRTRP